MGMLSELLLILLQVVGVHLFLLSNSILNNRIRLTEKLLYSALYHRPKVRCFTGRSDKFVRIISGNIYIFVSIIIENVYIFVTIMIEREIAESVASSTTPKAVAIFGPCGAGKTTLLNQIVDIQRSRWIVGICTAGSRL